jgi:uncharacterized protein YcfL
MNRTRFLLVSVCLLAAGCGTVNTTTTRDRPGDDSIKTQTRVRDLSTYLNLRASEVRLFPTEGGVLEAQVDVANDDRFPRGFSYRFAWLNERGNVIESPMSVWKATHVQAGGIITISSVAPDMSATDFRLEVRRAEK